MFGEQDFPVTILPEDNLGSLYEKLMGLGADLVLLTVAAIASKDIHPLPQNEALAIHKAPKIFKEMSITYMKT